MSWPKLPPWQARAQKQAEAKWIEEERNRHKEVVGALHALADELKTQRQEQATENSKKQSREIWTIRGLFLTAGIALLGFGVSLCQTRLTVRSVRDSENDSATQSKQTQAALLLTKQAANAATDQVARLTDSNQTAKETLLVNSRAWIAVEGASSKAPAAGTELAVAIRYVNTGRDPATEVKYHTQFFAFTKSQGLSGGFSNVLSAYDGKCPGISVDYGGVAYPTAGNSTYTLTSNLPAKAIDSGVISGAKTVAVVGCFTYKTFEAVRHNYFCFFYQAPKSDPNTWNFCQGGNYED